MKIEVYGLRVKRIKKDNGYYVLTIGEHGWNLDVNFVGLWELERLKREIDEVFEQAKSLADDWEIEDLESGE